MKNVVRALLFLLVVYLLFSIESPLLRSFNIRFYAPDPGLALVVVLALTIPVFQGVVVSSLLGLMRDAFASGVPVGTHAEIYVIIFLVCTFVASRLDYRNPVLTSFVLFCASLLSSLLLFVFLAIFDRDFDQFDLIFRLALPQALITAPMGPIMAGIVKMVDYVLSRESRRAL